MVVQTPVGWILDVSKDSGSDDIIILIKLQEDNKVISFKQSLHEYIFYILPKSRSAGEDLIQQLSRYDQIIKWLYWSQGRLKTTTKLSLALLALLATLSIPTSVLAVDMGGGGDGGVQRS
jgi:hypothetical protein